MTGDHAAARADIAAAVRMQRPSTGFEDGESLVRLLQVEVLVATDDPAAARAAAATAAARLRERAQRLVEPWRTSFLAKPAHVATFALERRLTDAA
jgi:hypothetical protein